MDKPVIKFTLAENVFMTDRGLMKQCVFCREMLPLRCFRRVEHKAFMRNDGCIRCVPNSGNVV